MVPDEHGRDAAPLSDERAARSAAGAPVPTQPEDSLGGHDLATLEHLYLTEIRQLQAENAALREELGQLRIAGTHVIVDLRRSEGYESPLKRCH